MTVEDDDEMTPVPQAPPEISDEERERRRRITGQDLRSFRDSQRPQIPTISELTQVVADLMKRLDANQASLTQVIDLLNHRDASSVLKDASASQALLRTVAEAATELAAQQQQLSAEVAHYRKSGPGASDAAEALGRVELMEAKLYGSDLDPKDNGDIGRIDNEATAARKYARRFFAATVGALLGSLGLVIAAGLASASDGGALRNQVEADGAMIRLLQVQVQTISTYLYGSSPRTGGIP